MISTLLNYRLYTDNLARSLERVEAVANVRRDAEYYKENIGKVETVDEFMGDRRLYSYALKAYGLAEQVNSQAFIRKILESDLSDSSSFANRLADARYRNFAAAFDFSGAAAPRAQSAGQTDRLVEAYSERAVRSAAEAAARTNHYEARIGGIRTAQAFVNDPTLFDVALRSVGISDPSIYDRAYVRDVLTGAITPTDPKLVALKAQFSFGADAPPQTAAQVRDLVYAYNQATGNGASPQAAQADIDYYNEQFATGAPVSTLHLASDPRIMRIMLTAVGFEVTNHKVDVLASVLASDPSNPSSYLNRLPESNAAQIADKQRFRALRDLFDAASPSSEGIARVTQNVEDGQAIADGYLANYRNKAINDDRLATNSFRVRLPEIDSVSDLMAQQMDLAGRPIGGRRTLDYVLKAFGLDPATESLSKIRQVLTSDPSDPNSFVSKLNDERYSQLAAAFNFDERGKLRPERLVQSIADQTQTARLYAASFGANQTAAGKELVRAATQDYLEAMGGIYSLDGLLADEKALAFALKAHGVADTDLSQAELRKILTSDLGDESSYANTHSDKAVAKFAAAFNFEPDGSVAEAISGVQSGAERLATEKLYLLQTMEEEAGATSEGTRLALYFLRMAPEIRTPLSILADKALFEVVRTALGLPASMSQLDIDRQAAILESRIDLSAFSDPARLDRFVSRFSVLYDIENGGGGASSPILALFGGGSSTGIAGLF